MDRNYQAAAFTVPTRRDPRTGGMILARAGSAAEAHALVANDPLPPTGAAEHQIIEFVPSKRAAGYQAL